MRRELTAVVLTGFNTDIKHAGTTYHVQTEDKGRSNPLVESLVYTSGEILYTQRTPYDDLVAQDVDREAVASLMERQHRSIVDAVQSGGLARLTGKIEQIAADDDTTITYRDEVPEEPQEEQSLDQVILDYLEAQRNQAHLILRATVDHDFTYGVVAPVGVSAVDSKSNAPQVDVKISVLFKSTAEPRRAVLAEGSTGEDGTFSAEADMPAFAGGTSAVVIVAESDLGRSEIKHLVHK
jgi:hypothetical protein